MSKTNKWKNNYNNKTYTKPGHTERYKKYDAKCYGNRNGGSINRGS